MLDFSLLSVCLKFSRAVYIQVIRFQDFSTILVKFLAIFRSQGTTNYVIFILKRVWNYALFFTNLSINCVLDSLQVLLMKNNITNWKCVIIQHDSNHITPVSFIHEHTFLWECEEKSKKAYFYWNKKWASTNCSVKYTHFPRTLFLAKWMMTLNVCCFFNGWSNWLWGLSSI